MITGCRRQWPLGELLSCKIDHFQSNSFNWSQREEKVMNFHILAWLFTYRLLTAGQCRWISVTFSPWWWELLSNEGLDWMSINVEFELYTLGCIFWLIKQKITTPSLYETPEIRRTWKIYHQLVTMKCNQRYWHVIGHNVRINEEISWTINAQTGYPTLSNGLQYGMRKF